MGATDRDSLDQQYSSDANLAARQAIYAHRVTGRPVLWDWAFDLAGIAGDERIVEVGCGNGTYLRALEQRGHRGTVVGLDLSAGMLAAARDRCDVPLAVADAQRLPLPTSSADVVLAMHMLYHVPDQAAAVRELRRVARDDGVVLFATNSLMHMRELDEVLVASIEAVTGIRPALIGESLSFTMESGAAVLHTAFASVERHDTVGSLAVSTAEPVVAYAASTMAASEHDATVIDELARRVDAAIQRDGAFEIRTAAGCFVCR